MEALGRGVARDVVLLSLTAGSADAVGYLSLGAFTSNMTGNTVLMGIHLGQGDYDLALRGIFVLGVFLVGVTTGAWLGRDVPEKHWPALAFRLIGMEKILLLIFGIAWYFSAREPGSIAAYALLSLLAMAMGLQSAALNRLSAPGVATTAITGTFTALTSGLVNHLFITPTDSEKRSSNLSRVRFQFCVLIFYAGGAVLSGFLILHSVRFTGFLPIVAAAFVSMGRAR